MFIFEISETDFWQLPIRAVHQIAMNKLAFENWKLSEQERSEKRG